MFVGGSMAARAIDWHVVHRLEGPEALYYSGSVAAHSRMGRGRTLQTSSCHFREGLWGMAGGHTASVQPDRSLPSLVYLSWFEWHLGLRRCFNIRDEIRDPAALPSSLRPPPLSAM